jgi:hypothetical protein
MPILRHPLSMFVLILCAIWFVGTVWSTMLPISLDPVTYESLQTDLTNVE